MHDHSPQLSQSVTIAVCKETKIHLFYNCFNMVGQYLHGKHLAKMQKTLDCAMVSKFSNMTSDTFGVLEKNKTAW